MDEDILDRVRSKMDENIFDKVVEEWNFKRVFVC